MRRTIYNSNVRLLSSRSCYYIKVEHKAPKLLGKLFLYIPVCVVVRVVAVLLLYYSTHRVGRVSRVGYSLLPLLYIT
jgi:hypothetical protein